MKVAHKYPFKYQVNDLAFSKDGSKLFICTGNGEGRRAGWEGGVRQQSASMGCAGMGRGQACCASDGASGDTELAHAMGEQQ